MIQERTRRCRINEAIAYIMEASAESDSEKMAKSDVSDEEYLPYEGECMNDANPETDRPVEGSASNGETDIDLDTEKSNSSQLCLMIHLKTSFPKDRLK